MEKERLPSVFTVPRLLVLVNERNADLTFPARVGRKVFHQPAAPAKPKYFRLAAYSCS